MARQSRRVKWLTRTFVKGLVVLLPITVTTYVLFWLARTAEHSLGGLLRLILPDRLYVAGLGVAAGFGIVFATGMLMNLWFTQRIVRSGERLLERLPLVKTLYGSVKDLMGLFSTGGERHLHQVVLVEFPGLALLHLGFLTTEDLAALGDAIEPEEGDAALVAVFLPMSYQIGGFTVFVPRSRITPVDMSVEEAMRFAITAGVSKTRKHPGKAR